MLCYAEATTAAVAAAQSLEGLHAPEVTVKALGPKKKGAVIGSAPKLSHEGLVAAAKAAEEKVAAEAALEKRAKQLATKKAAAAAAKANKQKKMAAPGGGIGYQPRLPQNRVELPAAVSVPVSAATVEPETIIHAVADSVSAASVQGKIHQGKWSRRKQ